MKIGRLIYGKKQKDMSEKVFCNYGDNIQTIALDHIIKEVFPGGEIVNINIYDLPYYNGEYVLLPLNCNFWTCDENYFLPASDKIIPIFIGVSFQIPPKSKEAINYLKKWAPIGCRDYETLNMMRKLGIRAYLNGCVTLTLPRRKKEPEKKKTFIVGLSELVKEKVLEKLVGNVEEIGQLEIYENDKECDIVTTDKKTMMFYKRYQEEATLVVTSKLHCASPCIAMGIPVIIIREKKSCRFEWINRLVPVYTMENIDEINWEPDIVKIEELKNKMKTVIMKRIQEDYFYYSDKMEISDFFEFCEHKEAKSVSEQIIEAVKDSKKDSYIIWGIGGYLGNAIYKIISEACPDIAMVAAVDKYKNLVFHGKQTMLPKEIEKYKDAFVIVTTASGEPDAVNYMKSLGRMPGKDYFTFSMIS